MTGMVSYVRRWESEGRPYSLSPSERLVYDFLAYLPGYDDDTLKEIKEEIEKIIEKRKSKK
ncbi:MAG: hypothetical protein QW752_05270 [Thermoplasmata archaeon]